MFRKRNRNRRRSQKLPFWKIFAIAIALILSLLSVPALAQNRGISPVPRSADSTAFIILDGRQLFKVAPAGDYPAQFRADWINSELKKAATSSEAVAVKVEERNQLPTILLDEQYLLTVTRRDAAVGMTPEEQAKVWAAQIQQALQQAQQERSSEFISFALLQAAIFIAIAIALHVFAGHLWHRYLQVWLRRQAPEISAAENDSPRAADILLNLTLLIARTAVWLVAIFHVTNLFPFTRHWSYRIADSLIASVTSPIITLSKNGYSVLDILILSLLLFGLVILSGIATNLFKSRILHVTGINRGAQEAVAVIFKYTALAIGTLVVLQIWGLDISSLALLASALGVGIGFGFQDIAKNFGSSIVLIFERRIQIGDFIEVGEYRGTVERIGGRSTAIRTLDNISIIVPNSRLLEKEVINWSNPHLVSRLSLPVGVAYGSDLGAVKAALLEAAQECDRVLISPPPQVLFKGYSDSCLNFNLLVWTEHPSQQYILKSDLYFRIDALFRERNIEIPFPQQDLHLRSGNLPVTLSPELEQVLLLLVEKLASRQNGNSPTDKNVQYNHKREE